MNPTREPVDLGRMAKDAFKIPSFICLFLLAAAACRSPKPAATIELSELTVARIHAAYENGSTAASSWSGPSWTGSQS